MPNLKYLMEREAAYSVDGIGFPSISGCIAIVYQVQDGLFGFHNAGNSANDKFDLRAKKWADFVLGHAKGRDPGLALYGVTFARANERGYSQPPVGNWKAELKTFASRLGFAGTLIGHDLSLDFTAPGKKPSAYVEFLREGNGYSLYVREWYDNAKDGVTKADFMATTDFKNLDSTTSKKMVTGVDRAGLFRVYPERLGGL